VDAETYLQDRTVCSGTWHWTSASTGEERASIDFEINTTGAELPPYVRLHYRLTKNGENLDYNVSLATTRPDWGGLRWWFICPLSVNGHTCGRRVRKLYLPRGGKYYGCRHCHDLSYESRRNDGKYAALFKAQAIRMRLGGSPSVCDPFPAKPKGMWLKTYQRLWEQEERYYASYVQRNPI
jgi:hypothetical protein